VLLIFFTETIKYSFLFSNFIVKNLSVEKESLFKIVVIIRLANGVINGTIKGIIKENESLYRTFKVPSIVYKEASKRNEI
jgi:hypothetical protein